MTSLRSEANNRIFTEMSDGQIHDSTATTIIMESSTCRLNPFGDAESYHSYWATQALAAYESDNAVVIGCFSDIEKELERLNENGWNNLDNFLKPVGRQKFTLIHLAAYNGRIDILERAVELYAGQSTVCTSQKNGGITDPWLATDKFGRCALHYAAAENHSEAVTWILRQGVPEGSVHPQISLPDVFGRTPLHDAVGRLNADVVELLVDAGAAVNVPNEHGIPPFLPLKEDGTLLLNMHWDGEPEMYHEIITFLGDKISKNDLNISHSRTGWTMLHHAILLESHRTVKYLVQKGADPNMNAGDEEIKDQMRCVDDGLSALQYAIIHRDSESVHIFVNNGGNLAKAFSGSGSRAVIDDSHLRSTGLVIENFLTDLFTAQLKFNDGFNKNTVTLNYDVLTPKEEPRQMAVISVLIKAMPRKRLHTISKHPLLQLYIGKQCGQFLKVFYTFVILYTFFVIFLSWYTIRLVNYNSDSACLRRLMLSSAFTLFCCHSLEFLADPKWYLKQPETWMSFFSLMLPIIVAFVGEFVSNVSSSWILHTLSVVFSLIGIRITLFLRQVVFLRWGYYALLLSIVLKSVSKVLIIGFSIIGGFTLSFLILFHNNNQFDNLWKALCRTVVMMMGEYAYGNLFSTTATNNLTEYNSNSKNEIYDNLPPVTGRILFIIFVIIAGIVLMNLMIGLAVNDIQALVIEGKFHRLLKQAMFIAHYEQTILNYGGVPAKMILGCGVVSRMLTNLVDVVEMMPKRCLRETLPESTGIKDEVTGGNKLFLNAPRPSEISAEVWKEIGRLYEKYKSGRPRIREMKSDKSQVTLAALQATLEVMKSQIQQLIQDRNADIE